MKIAPLIAFAALAGAIYIQRERVLAEIRPLFDPAESLDLTSFNAEATRQVNERRVTAGVPVAEASEELQNWLLRRSLGAGFGSAQATLVALQTEIPVFADVEARLVAVRRQREALDSVVSWPSATSARYTHFATMLTRDPAEPDRVVCLAVAARKLPFFEPDLLDQAHAEFCARCPLCGHEQPAAVERSPNGVILTCHDCQRPYAMLCQGLEGKYHHVNEFLSGFDPPAYFPEGLSRTEEMLIIWKWVLEHCRYTRDAEGISGPRDYWQSAEETHEIGNGDCEDTSILLADWLISRGFEARVALGVMTDDSGVGEGHAWVVVRVGSRDFLLETTGLMTGDDRPPTVAAWGHYYSPQYLFDRNAVYFRKTEGWTPDYWSRSQWSTVRDPDRSPPGETDGEGLTENGEPVHAGQKGNGYAAGPATASAWLGGRAASPPSTGNE